MDNIYFTLSLCALCAGLEAWELIVTVYQAEKHRRARG